MLLHHENKPVPTAGIVKALLDLWDREVMNYPYSPDLAPCDFYLFPRMKESLCGRRFEPAEDIMNTTLCEFPSGQPLISAAFDAWSNRWAKCLNLAGPYVELRVPIFFALSIEKNILCIRETYF